MKTKTLCIFLALALLTTLFAACAGGNAADGTSAADNTPVAENTQAEDEPQTASSGDVVEIEFFNQKSEIVAWVDELIEMFEAENPGIKVTQTQVPNANQVLTTRIQTGDLPDVIGCYPGTADFPDIVHADVLMDITDTGLLDNIDPAMYEGLDVDGRQWAAPLTYNAWGIFYNKTKFAEYDLEVPATWAEFEQLCEDIKAVGETPLCPSLKDAWTVTHIAQSIFMSFAPYEDIHALVNDTSVSFSDSEYWDEFIRRYDFFIDNSLPNSPTQGYPEAAADFAYENALMCPMGIWVMPMFEEYGMQHEDIGIFVFPNDAGAGVVPIGVDIAIGIGGNTEHPEEALAFAKFMASPEAAQYLADREGSPSTVNGVVSPMEPTRGVTQLIGQEGRTCEWFHMNWNPTHGGEWDAEMQSYTLHRNSQQLLENLDRAFEKE